jgi:ankyrin repeat protein
MLSTESDIPSKLDKAKLLQLAEQFDNILDNKDYSTPYKIKKIRKLFAEGFTIEFEYPNGDTSFHRILTLCNPFCDVEMMIFALDSLLDSSFLTKQNAAGESLLHLAILSTTIDAFKLLLLKCPRSILSVRDENDDTPLHAAASQDEIELIKLMLSGLPSDEARRLLNKTGANDFTVIEAAIDNHQVNTVKFLKKLGVLITKETIQLANETEHKPTINAVGTRIQQGNSSHRNTTHASKKKKQVQLCKIRYSINSKKTRLAAEFIQLITDDTLSEAQKIKKIHFLFKGGLAKDHKFFDGKSLAHRVLLECKSTFLAVLSDLLSNESTIEAVDNSNNNLLHYAAESSVSKEIFEHLLKACKKDKIVKIPALFAQNNEGKTPLHIAALHGDNLFISLVKGYLPPVKFIELLSIKTKDHKTSLQEAITEGNRFTIRLLYSYCHGQNIDGNDDDSLCKLAQETKNQKTISLVTELVATQKPACPAHQESPVKSQQALSSRPLTKKSNDKDGKSKKKSKKSSYRKSPFRTINSAISQEDSTFELSESVTHSLSPTNKEEEKAQSSLLQDDELESHCEPAPTGYETCLSLQKESGSSFVESDNIIPAACLIANSLIYRSRYAFFPPLLEKEDAENHEQELRKVTSLSKELALTVLEDTKNTEESESTPIMDETSIMQKEQKYIFSLPEEDLLSQVDREESSISSKDQIYQDKISSMLHILALLPIQEATFSNDEIFNELLNIQGVFQDTHNAKNAKKQLNSKDNQLTDCKKNTGYSV